MERYQNYVLAGYEAFHRFLGDTRQDENLAREVLEVCRNCQCCHDHQQRKPSQYQPWVPVSLPTQTETHRECQCPCRHLARWVCRYHPDSQLLASEPENDHPVSDSEIEFAQPPPQ